LLLFVEIVCSLKSKSIFIFLDLGFWIWDFGFGILDLGFWIWDLGFGIWELKIDCFYLLSYKCTKNRKI